MSDLTPSAGGRLLPSPAGGELAVPPWRFLPERLRSHSVLIGKFLGVQTIVQALSFLVGLIVVRHLSKQEYAHFTVANSLQGTMNILADTGVATALSAIGGRVWHDRARFSRLLATALEARRPLTLAVVVVTAPLLCFLLSSVGATRLDAVVITVLVTVGVVIQTRCSILSCVPRFHAQIRFLQRFDLGCAVLRLAAFGIAALWMLDSRGSIAINVAIFALGLWWLQRHGKGMVDLAVEPDPEDRKAIFASMKALAANTVFFCLQGQIAVWLISVFGNASATAEVGALGRIGVIYTVFISLMNSVLLPSFARTHDYRDALRKYWLIFGGFCGLGLALALVTWFFPGPLLWLLGPQYAHLRHELFLITIGGSLGAAFGSLWMMNSSRGWIRHAWLYIPATLVTQAILACFLDLSQVEGVLIFSIFSQFPVLVLNAFLSWNGFRALRAETEIGGLSI